MEEGNDRRRDAWKYLLEVLSHQRRGLAIGIAVGLVWTVGKIAIPQLTRHAIDSGIERGGSVVVWAVLIGCTGLMTGTFTALRRYVAFRESRLTETRLRERLFDHILGLHIGYHDRAQTGQLMSRSSSDLNQMQAFVVMIPLTISNLALVAGVVVILFFTDPLLALVALAPLPFVNVMAKRFSRGDPPGGAGGAGRAGAARHGRRGDDRRRAGDQGFRRRAACRPTSCAPRPTTSSAFRCRRRACDRASSRRSTCSRSLGLIAVLGIGGHRVLNGQMTVGELVFNCSTSRCSCGRCATIGMTVALGQRAAAALERVDEVLRTVPEIADPAQPVAPARHPTSSAR